MKRNISKKAFELGLKEIMWLVIFMIFAFLIFQAWQSIKNSLFG